MRHRDAPYVGLKSRPAGYTFSTDRYDQTQLIYVTGGCLTINGRTDLGAGMTVLLPLECAFRLSSEGGYEGVFRLDCPDRADRTRSASRKAAPDLADPSPCERVAWAPADRSLQEAVGIVLRELSSPRRLSDSALRAMGELFRSLAMRAIADSEGGCPDRPLDREYADFWTRTVRQVIDSHLYSDRCLGDLLSSVGRSYRHLSRCFTSVMGITPKSYQIRRRSEEALRLLRGTSMPVIDIAMELGYPSSQHFAAQFKRIYGITPREARRRSHESDSQDTREGNSNSMTPFGEISWLT